MKRKLNLLLVLSVCFALLVTINIEVFQQCPSLLWLTLPASILGMINIPYKKFYNKNK